MTSSSINRGASAEKLSVEARRSIIGSVISLFMDTYDLYLPALVLPAAMGYFQPASLPDAIKVTLTTLVITIGLLARPLGSIVFGSLSDKIGRKKVTMMAGAGFTLSTLLIAIMPGYAQWGYAAIGVLLFLRLVDGMFLGGGYAGAIPLAFERSPVRLRGLVGGLATAGAPFSFVVLSVVQLVVLSGMSRAAFSGWGWRLPFFFGVLLGIFYLLYYSRVSELDAEYWGSERSKPRQPLRELFSGDNFRNLGQVLVLTAGYWFALQMVVSFLPALLIGILHISPKNVTWIIIVGSVFNVAGIILVGMLGQRIGRRRLLIWAGVCIAVLTTLAYYLMIQMAKGGSAVVLIGLMVVIIMLITNTPLSALMTYLNERFPTRVRSTGWSVGYTFGIILPSLYSFWLLWLGRLMPYVYTELVLILLGGVLMLYGASLGPETRDVELLVKE